MINISSVGDEIWVASGLYYPTQFPPTATGGFWLNQRYETFLITDGIKLYGSFLGTESSIDQRNIIANPSILSGDIGVIGDSSDNCFHVIVAAADTSGSGIGVTIDGFTIVNGNADDFTGNYYIVNGNHVDCVAGGGIMLIGGNNIINNNILHNNQAYTNGGGISVTNGNAVITNNIIYDNSYSYTAGTMRGAGISLYYGSNYLYKNTIYNNSSSMAGGGINSWYCNNRIYENVITNNFAQGQGAAIYTNQSTDTIYRNIIHDNSANFASIVSDFSNEYIKSNFIYNNTGSINGGGIYFYHGINELINNVLFNNITSGKGGGIYTQMGTCLIINNTFFGNKATINGGAIYTEDTSGINTIVNNIFGDNAQAGNMAIAGSDIFNNNANNTVKYCITQPNSIYHTGTGIINNVNPLFLNSADFDGVDNILGTADDGFSLQILSPAINSGTIIGSPLNDIIGTVRPQGGGVDMGAYELLSLTGIGQENKIELQASIFPNPADNIIQINFDQKISSIVIYNVEGQIVRESLSPVLNCINISDLANGFYIVTAKTEYGTLKQKLIVKH